MAGIRVRVKERGDGLKKLVEKLRREVRGANVKAGILGSDAARDGDPVGMVEIAATHEFGATFEHPGGTPYFIGSDGLAVFVKKGDSRATHLTKPHRVVIPERSFLRSAFTKNQDEYEKRLGQILQGIVNGKMTARKGLTALGFQMVKDIREGITEGSGIPPPNAPMTIARKGSDRPLVDSGQLVKSLTHEVVLPDQKALPSGDSE